MYTTFWRGFQRQPDMTADWLTINLRRSSEYWFKLEAELRREYGVAALRHHDKQGDRQAGHNGRLAQLLRNLQSRAA